MGNETATDIGTTHMDMRIPVMFSAGGASSGRGSNMAAQTALMSVRELILELSRVKEALRRNRTPISEAGGASDDGVDIRELVHREQLIIRELRRRARARAPWR